MNESKTEKKGHSKRKIDKQVETNRRPEKEIDRERERERERESVEVNG